MKRLIFILPLFCSLFIRAQNTAQRTVPVIRLTDSARCTEVKDQGMSPTCWVFGTNSLFESDLLKMYGVHFNLSEMFIARHAYVDKARQFLATGGKTYFAGGGQFRDVLRVIDRYGMMPEEAYNGKVNSNRGHDHTALDTAMKKYIHGLLEQGKKVMTEKEMEELNKILDTHLGEIPPAFLYEGKLYTPKSFAKEVIRFSNDYVEVMSFADLPLYKKSLFNDKFNWAGDSVYNISLQDMQLLVDTALAKGWSVAWEGDVTEKGFNQFSGLVQAPDSAYNFDQKRLAEFRAETTERDHMLHLVGIGKDGQGNKWYYLKNSWGAWVSKYKGFLFMDENYFRLKTMIMMVHKDALPQRLKKKLGIK